MRIMDAAPKRVGAMESGGDWRARAATRVARTAHGVTGPVTDSMTYMQSLLALPTVKHLFEKKKHQVRFHSKNNKKKKALPIFF